MRSHYVVDMIFNCSFFKINTLLCSRPVVFTIYVLSAKRDLYDSATQVANVLQLMVSYYQIVNNSLWRYSLYYDAYKIRSRCYDYILKSCENNSLKLTLEISSIALSFDVIGMKRRFFYVLGTRYFFACVILFLFS